MSDDDFERFPYDDERFNKGVQHVVDLFAKTLGVEDWKAGDGSENYDDDLQQTLLNIMEARNIYDPETGLLGFSDEVEKLRYQLVKRTEALNDALDYVEADLLFSVFGQNLRNKILAALTDDLQKSDCRHEDYCLHPNCECGKSTEPGYTQYTGFRP